MRSQSQQLAKFVKTSSSTGTFNVEASLRECSSECDGNAACVLCKQCIISKARAAQETLSSKLADAKTRLRASEQEMTLVKPLQLKEFSTTI